MSSTRHAAPGSPLRQERYASSPAISDNGLKPTCVAKRSAVLNDAKQREVIWYLQARSHLPGGLAAVVSELLEIFGARICPPSLLNFTGKKDSPLAPELVRAARAECNAEDRFLMREEFTASEQRYLEICQAEARIFESQSVTEDKREMEIRAAAQQRPDSYSAADFQKHTRLMASCEFEKHLAELCLNPESSFSDPWYFCDLFSALVELVDLWASEHSEDAAETSIASAMRDAVTYAAETGSIVLICAPEGFGKSFHARAYCRRHPGLARYWQIPASNDRRLFFGAGAQAFNGPIGDSWKAQELQRRLEEIAAQSGIVLVMDDALQLLPDRERDANPDRVDWVVTALAERGIPAVLITNHTFDKRLRAIEQRSTWSAQSFRLRCVRPELPEQLSKEDVKRTAQAMLPGIKADELRDVVTHTLTAGGRNLHFLETVRRAADFVARRQGANGLSAEHINEALRGFALASVTETAKAKVRAESKAAGHTRKHRAPVPRAPSAPAPLATRVTLASSKPHRQTMPETAPADS